MYKSFNDNEILYMINESDDYIELVLEKYKPVITKICKKYLKIGEKIGLELDDLMQISNMTIVNCIKYYKDNLNTSFYTYIIKCVENNLRTELRKESTFKRIALNTSSSLDEIIKGTDITLLDLIKDDRVIDPINYLIIEEKEIEYIKFVNSLPFEVAVVFEMKNNGFTNYEISKFMNINNTEIGKYMQFARHKLCLN